MLSAEGAAASAVPVLANLPRQPPPAAPGCGLLHRADAHLQDAVHLLLHHARAPPHRAFQRGGTSDNAVGVASVAGGDAVGQQPRYLIRDRDRSYGGAFIGKARAIGIKTVLTAVRPPQANAIAEARRRNSGG